MRKSIFLGIFLVNIYLLPAQKLVPADFSFRSIVADSTDSLNSSNKMLSNVVTEVILQKDQAVWLGTGLGVSVIRDSLTVDTLPDTTGLVGGISGAHTNRLPQGGISAMAASGQGSILLIAVAGSENDIPVGKGVAFTTDATDSVINWTYYDQPIDNELSDTIPFGDIGYVAVLPITVPQANVTYDIAFSDEFAWIASWAGGLRRYKLLDKSWERVPLPMDDQFELTTCVDTSYVQIGGIYIKRFLFESEGSNRWR